MADVVIMPKLGFDMAEGVLVRWVVAEGASIAKGDLLAEIETDKATVEVQSNFAGIVQHHLIEEGAVVPVGDPIAVIGEAGEEIDLDAVLAEFVLTDKEPEVESVEPSLPEEDLPKSPVEAPMAAGVLAAAGDGAGFPDGVRASPLARRMAQEEGLNIQEIPGSGPSGRITKKDVLSYLEVKASSPAPVAQPVFAGVESTREDRLLPISRLRSAIGRRMTLSKQQVPHFYVTYDYDMKAVMAMRSEVNSFLEAEGIKLSVNDFILKAVAMTLREFPNLNASLGEDHIQHHGQINIGVAVAVEEGLLTVVCHDADLKSLRQISFEVREKAARAREGKIQPDDVEGSTFTVSNLGMFGVEDFVAIINPPEAAILAVGGVREVPVIENGNVELGMRMKATISVDHRVSDGAEGARFMQALAGYMEHPARFLAA